MIVMVSAMQYYYVRMYNNKMWRRIKWEETVHVLCEFVSLSKAVKRHTIEIDRSAVALRTKMTWMWSASNSIISFHYYYIYLVFILE